MLDDIAEMFEQIRKSDPLRYIVIDHSLPVDTYAEERDGNGSRYMLCSPALFDAVKITKGPPPIFSISVYRMSDMPEGWPEVGLP